MVFYVFFLFNREVHARSSLVFYQDGVCCTADNTHTTYDAQHIVFLFHRVCFKVTAVRGKRGNGKTF
jgi:hypothetical protein